MTPEFCQAQSALFLPSVTAVPRDGINMVEFADGLRVVPESMWHFADPQDPGMCYIAKFPPADVSGMQGDITATAEGVLFHVSKECPPDDCDLDASSMRPRAGQKATMLVVGRGGRCNGVFALVCHA